MNHGRLRTLDQPSVTQWREWGEINGISVLLHNYPGYGKTPGPVTVERILSDLGLLVQFLRQRWRDEQISVLGNSIGSTLHTHWFAAAKGTQGVAQRSILLPAQSMGLIKSFLYHHIQVALGGADGISRSLRALALILLIRYLSWSGFKGIKCSSFAEIATTRYPPRTLR